MTTAVYYTEEKHSLPSLSSIMSTQSDELFSNPSQPSTANTTPASSFSGKSGVPDGLSSNTMGHQPMANKCTCKSNANRIPRPRNAFILFRQKYHQSVLEEGTVIRTNPEVSRELGRRWRALSNEDREHWNQLAEEEKTNHAKKYPGYRYTPRRNGKNKNCEYCKQKNLRQQQIQLHNQQLLSLQDQYYMQQQQQGQGQPPMGQQQHPPPMGQQYAQQYNQQLGQMNQMPQQLSGSQSLNGTQTPNQMNNMMYNYPSFNQQLPMNNMQFFIPSNLNPIQTNFVYNNDDKLSPLSQPFDQHYQQGQGVQPPQQQQQQTQQPQSQQPQQTQQPQPQSAQLSASSQPTSANGVAGIPGTNQLPGSIPPVGGFNPQFAVGYERFNLPNPYGFENNYSN